MKTIKNIISKLYKLIVSGKQKAVIAFVIATVGTYVARHGWTLNSSLLSDLQALGVGVLAHIGVYFKKNK